MTLVDEQEDGSPKGEKHFLFYNPPLVDRELGIRRSAVVDARLLAERFLGADIQTIVFARSRLVTEVLLTYLRHAAQREGRPLETVQGYRGGYLPTERREIERGLRERQVLGVVATNALELGINIGGLDACIMTGYPGTIASTWQQAGRAGRRSRRLDGDPGGRGVAARPVHRQPSPLLFRAVAGARPAQPRQPGHRRQPHPLRRL